MFIFGLRLHLKIAEYGSLTKIYTKLVPQLDKAKISEHFKKEGIARSTIYANIKRFENVNSFKKGISTGRPFKFTARMRTHLKKAVNNKSPVT